MNKNIFKRVPKHIGIIPDGNRRWAVANGMNKQDGYDYGIDPGFELYKLCIENGVKEITFYGFTQDNTKRPSQQTEAFTKACIDAVSKLSNRDGNLMVIGNTDSPLFPKELLPYTNRVTFGKGIIKINFLVNYGWNWALNQAHMHSDADSNNFHSKIASSDISKIDLILRWGGRYRLSGFLPIQSVYSDFYVINDMWPDFKSEHFYKALEWYQDQDVTLGG